MITLQHTHTHPAKRGENEGEACRRQVASGRRQAAKGVTAAVVCLLLWGEVFGGSPMLPLA